MNFWFENSFKITEKLQNSSESSHVPYNQRLLLLVSYISVVRLLQLMNQ